MKLWRAVVATVAIAGGAVVVGAGSAGATTGTAFCTTFTLDKLTPEFNGADVSVVNDEGVNEHVGNMQAGDFELVGSDNPNTFDIPEDVHSDPITVHVEVDGHDVPHSPLMLSRDTQCAVGGVYRECETLTFDNSGPIKTDFLFVFDDGTPDLTATLLPGEKVTFATKAGQTGTAYVHGHPYGRFTFASCDEVTTTTTTPGQSSTTGPTGSTSPPPSNSTLPVTGSNLPTGIMAGGLVSLALGVLGVTTTRRRAHA